MWKKNCLVHWRHIFAQILMQTIYKCIYVFVGTRKKAPYTNTTERFALRSIFATDRIYGKFGRRRCRRYEVVTTFQHSCACIEFTKVNANDTAEYRDEVHPNCQSRFKWKRRERKIVERSIKEPTTTSEWKKCEMKRKLWRCMYLNREFLFVFSSYSSAQRNVVVYSAKKKRWENKTRKEKEKRNRIEYEKHFPFTLYALPCVLFAYSSLRILSLLNFVCSEKQHTRARLASSAFGIFSLFSVFFLSAFFTYFVSFLRSFDPEN